jgi:hypothetical protein
MWPRVAALALHGLCYLLVTVGTVMAPANQAERELRRKTAKTWGKPISNLVVTSQHLTVCSLGALVLYLSLVCWDSQSEVAGALVAVLMPMQTVVGVLYWGLVLWDPWLLFPRETFPPEDKVAEAVIRRVTRVPKLDHPELAFFWSLMQQQHTLAPLHLWLEHWAGVLPASAASSPGLLRYELGLVAAVGIAYIVWNFFCWRVRGAPAYPVQTSAGLAFYLGCFATAMCATVVSHTVRLPAVAS